MGTPLKSPATMENRWYATLGEETLSSLATSLDGLSSVEVENRRAKYGENLIPQATGESWLKILFRQINNPLIYVLLFSGLLAVLMGKPTDGTVVFVVVLVNTLIGFIQELRASKAIAALVDMVPNNCNVIRNRQTLNIPANELVPGDIVLLQTGDKVPADLRIILSKNLSAEESALTGESLPVNKNANPVAQDAELGDRSCLVFGGTLITAGTATGVVIATAGETELGKISAMLHNTEQTETPLTKSLAKVGKILTIGIVVVSVLIFIVGLLRGYAIIDATLAAITLAVAAIPEGLPAVVTIALAIGVRRMADQRAVIRRLPAVETLGSTSVICSDKTGTLTKNEMTVQALWINKGTYRITGVGYSPEGEILLENNQKITEYPAELTKLLHAGLLCNDASLQESAGNWTINGDPTEAALLVSAKKAGIDEHKLKEQWSRIDVIPFESERQFMATLHKTPEDKCAILLKGAPEVILKRCAQWLDGTQLKRNEILAQIENLASEGMRVLAFAYREEESHLAELPESAVIDNFSFIGLQAMIDPPRVEAIESIRKCNEAGIVVKMITGDHRATAQAIGKQLGLLNDSQPITGKQIAEMNDDELNEKVTHHNVFARVAPEHKLRLVKALQKQGNIVAMTGDGVNDAPALKRADIGVAMGITGTDVSKDAADVVLTDDNFVTIAAAVEEGRRVYDNLVKSLVFILPTNLGEALMILIAVAFFPIINGMPIMPILPVQILWINLVACVALALPLAFEAKERDIMQRNPRNASEPIFNYFVIVRTIVVTVLMTVGAVGMFLYEYHNEIANKIDPSIALKEGQTIAVTTVIIFQIFYLLNCRSLKESIFSIGLWSNWTIYLGVALILVLQLAFIYLPSMNSLFGSMPLDLNAWLKSLLVGAIILPVIIIEKWHRKRSEPDQIS